MIFGYARGRTKEQNIERQIKELKTFVCDKIYTEKQAGKEFNRPTYKGMKAEMRFKDILVVHDLSRFVRNKKEISDEWKSLIDREIDVVALNMPIHDTRKYKDLEGMRQLVSDIVFTFLSWMVDDDCQRIRITQQKGITITKKQGKYYGGKKRYHVSATGKGKVIYERVVKLLLENRSVIDIHREVGISRNTIYTVKADSQS